MNKTKSKKSRLLIVSNRLPVNISRRRGKLQINKSTGGVATGMASLHKKHGGLWIGWPGIQPKNEEERQIITNRLREEYDCIPVFLSQKELKGFYFGFTNKTLWPLFHYFPQYTEYNSHEWQTYEQVNRIFYDKISEIVREDDIIWVQDYHLMLLPAELRAQLPNVTIGFFLHIPFPSLEIFRDLPWRENVLRGVLGADLVGFHTFDYMRHFLSCCLRLLGLEHEFGKIHYEGRTVQVDAFPMGIDTNYFTELAHEPALLREAKNIKKNIGDCKAILSIERLDFTKGIPEALYAFDQFLKKYPEWHKKVVYILLCVPSRTKVESYKILKKEVDELIGRINGDYGVPGWTPIWYLFRSLPVQKLVPFYLCADVCLLTPLRDGMNLVAKEYIAIRRNMEGVLILSERAGASTELGEALIINPNDNDSIVEAIATAFSMPKEEQIERNTIMRRRLERYDIFRWGEDFMERLIKTKNLQEERTERKLTKELRNKLIDEYKKSSTRLLFFDYDGTLVRIVQKPSWANPDEELLVLLKQYTHDERNTVVIISGRDRVTLKTWLGDVGAIMIAEHGAWISKNGGSEWSALQDSLSDEWKDNIRPVLEMYVDRTPRSFIEEKSFSLSWHYRRAEPDLGKLRANELIDTLTGLVTGSNLQIRQGRKVVEVKLDIVSKGKAAQYLLNEYPDREFILAIGDDWTDEELFSALPEQAHTIKVRRTMSTQAKYLLKEVSDVRALLNDMKGVDIEHIR